MYAAILAILCAAPPSPLTATEPSHDAGEVRVGPPLAHLFTLTNTSAISAQCGSPSQEIPPTPKIDPRRLTMPILSTSSTCQIIAVTVFSIYECASTLAQRWLHAKRCEAALGHCHGNRGWRPWRTRMRLAG